MTDRIQELMEETGLFIAYGNQAVTEKELRFFAETIVKECLYNMENCSGDLDFAIWKTKKDFGINE